MLAIRGVLCLGPVVPRTSGPTREQYLVLNDDHIREAVAPADPLRELFIRFVTGHGPAGAVDFAWWAGLPLTAARTAAEASVDGLDEIGDSSTFLARPRPRRVPGAPSVIALPSFDEYYLSYADRGAVCAPELRAAVGPASNGMVRPTIVAHGEVVGVWTQSTAVERHADDPIPELFVPNAAADTDVSAALARYATFITG